MPLHQHKEQINQFSEYYELARAFGKLPNEIEAWHNDNPLGYMAYRAFFSGMAKGQKAKNDTIKPQGKKWQK